MAETLTLFGPAAEVAKPRTPAAAGVVRRLVALGVPEATARGFENRQAHAVLAAKERGRRAGPDPGEPAPPAGTRGAPTPVRLAEAAELRKAVAGRAGDEALIRRIVGGCLYLLTPAELRRVAGGLATLLEGGPARDPG